MSFLGDAPRVRGTRRVPPPRVSTSQLRGQVRHLAGFFRLFFTSPAEWREAPLPPQGSGGGVRGSVGPEPPGCGLVAGMLGTRAGFRESLSRGDIPEGLGVQLCESNRLNKRTTPGESLFGERGGMGVGRRAEKLYRMRGGGRVSPPCWHWFICRMDGIDLTWINCGACLGIEDLYPSFSKVLASPIHASWPAVMASLQWNDQTWVRAREGSRL